MKKCKKVFFVISIMFITLVFSVSAYATHRYKRIVDDQYMGKLSYGFDESVDSSWHTALEDAIDKYNDLGINLYYNSSTSSCPWDATFNVVVLVDNYGSGTYFQWEAKSEFPTFFGNEPGDEIKINTYYANDLNQAEKTSLLMHEIGHTIGLMHTDESSGYIITSTEPDPNINLSIFCSGSSEGAPTSFSYYDEIALQWLYD